MTKKGEHEEGEDQDNRRNALSKALTLLSERERRIFEARRLADNPMTLEKLAEEFGVSRERIRQIELHAFEKVQRAVQRRVMAIPRSVSEQDFRHQPAEAA